MASPASGRSPLPPRQIRCVTYLTCPANRALGSAYIAMGFRDQLARRGFDVSLVEPEQYMPLPRLGRATFYRQTIGLFTHSLRVVARRSADLLLFYGGEAWLALSVLSRLPRRARPALFLHSNGLEPSCAELLRPTVHDRGAPSRRWYQRDNSKRTVRGFERVDGLVVVSPLEGEYARRHGWPRNGQLLVLENPLPEPLLGAPYVPEREEIVGFCGGWSYGKGGDRMVRELPIFLRRNPSWRFRVFGHSRDAISEAFPSDVRDRIDWVPPLPRETGLAAELRKTAILISPALYESFGLAVAEAMAAGCAVVATPVGFAGGLEDRSEVLHCDAATPGELAKAIEELALDRALRERIARGGHARVQRLRWEEAGDRFARTLIGWIRRHQTGS